MTISNAIKEQQRITAKLEQQAQRLHTRLEKLADSTDEKIAAKATSDLTTIYISELAARDKAEAIAPLREEILDLKRTAKAADEALEPMTAERDALLLEVTELREQVTKNGPLQEQLDKMIAENAAWKKEQHDLLVSANQEYCWKAQRAETTAKETLEHNQRLFSSSGQEAVIEEMRRLIARHNIPQPDIWTLPKGTNPLLLELWGWDRLKARYFVALTQGYPEPTEAFRQLLFKYLKARLPIHGTMPDPIEHLSIRLEVMQMMCARWPGVWDQAQRRVDELEAQERGQAMLNNNRRLADQQTELAVRGYGRESIGQPEAQATDDPHFWNGFIPANPEVRPSEFAHPLEDDGPSEPFEDR